MRKITTHGHTRGSRPTSTYSSWKNMVGRCTQPSATGFAYYKKRGISVCERWLRFENFIADMGEKPQGTTIDRIDNSGNYEPSNCRWATWKEQADNRITNRKFEYPAGSGQFFNLVNLCRHTGVSLDILRSRLARGKGGPWTVEQAVHTPCRKGHRTDVLGPLASRNI